MVAAAFFGLIAKADAAPCSPEPTDMSVAYSALFSCDISPATDVDYYRFSGVAGDRAIVEAAFVSGTLFAPRIQLFAPDGTSIGLITSPPRIDVILPQTGTYTATVFNHYVTNATPGEYTFVVSCAGGSCVPTPPVPPAPPAAENIDCEPEPTDQFPFFGTRVSCDITPATDVDVYRFTGSAGDRVLTEAAWVSGDVFAPRIQVYAPNGDSVGLITSPPRLDFVLPQSGVYTALVFNHFVTNATGGQYTFTFTCIGGSCLPPPGKLPAVSLTLTGCTTCNAGDQFTARAHWSHPGSSTVPTEVKVGLRTPDGQTVNTVGDKHIEFGFPPGLNVDSNAVSFAWPAGQPLGTWTVEVTLLGPNLGETIARAVKTFVVVP